MLHFLLMFFIKVEISIFIIAFIYITVITCSFLVGKKKYYTRTIA